MLDPRVAVGTAELEAHSTPPPSSVVSSCLPPLLLLLLESGVEEGIEGVDLFGYHFFGFGRSVGSGWFLFTVGVVGIKSSQLGGETRQGICPRRMFGHHVLVQQWRTGIAHERLTANPTHEGTCILAEKRRSEQRETETTQRTRMGYDEEQKNS